VYNESVRSFNATDDFNPFHDQKKWNRIQGNPFGMPIVLGFQLEALVEYPVALLSCALLEKARQDNYAFETNPVVYTSHLVSVDVETAANTEKQ
jgi:hypothetical protein